MILWIIWTDSLLQLVIRCKWTAVWVINPDVSWCSVSRCCCWFILGFSIFSVQLLTSLKHKELFSPASQICSQSSEVKPHIITVSAQQLTSFTVSSVTDDIITIIPQRWMLTLNLKFKLNFIHDTSRYLYQGKSLSCFSVQVKLSCYHAICQDCHSWIWI